jgi:hypothetical protein
VITAFIKSSWIEENRAFSLDNESLSNQWSGMPATLVMLLPACVKTRPVFTLEQENETSENSSVLLPEQLNADSSTGRRPALH